MLQPTKGEIYKITTIYILFYIVFVSILGDPGAVSRVICIVRKSTLLITNRVTELLSRDHFVLATMYIEMPKWFVFIIIRGRCFVV